jgi:hypothetical protein
MDLEKKWMITNWSLEEIDLIEDIYLIKFWLQEDLKNFIDICFINEIPMSFAPPYSIAISKGRLVVLKDKIDDSKKKKTFNGVFEHSLPASLR